MSAPDFSQLSSLNVKPKTWDLRNTLTDLGLEDLSFSSANARLVRFMLVFSSIFKLCPFLNASPFWRVPLDLTGRLSFSCNLSLVGTIGVVNFLVVANFLVGVSFASFLSTNALQENCHSVN